MDFGNRVRDLRIAKKFTQRQLADELKIDFTYLSKIENNKLDHMPSEDVIRKMAAILEADAEELLTLASKGGRIDTDALRKTIDHNPEAGVLFRKLENRPLTDEQIEQMLKFLGEE